MSSKDKSFSDLELHIENTNEPELIPGGLLVTDNCKYSSQKSEDSRCTKCLSSFRQCCVRRIRQSLVTSDDLRKPLRKRRISSTFKMESEKENVSAENTLEPATGYFQRPERKFNTTLVDLRRSSSVVLEKQRFRRHTEINEEGCLIHPEIKQSADPHENIQSEEEEKEEDIMEEDGFSSVNYMLQMKLDEVIAMPRRPVDGYGEALLESVRPSSDVSVRRKKTLTSVISSVSSVPSKRTNLNHLRASYLKGVDRGPRGMASMSTPLFLALLPTFSDELKQEVMGDIGGSLAYIKYLETVFSLENLTRQSKFTSERWLAVVYIDYKPSKGVEAFRRLFIRFILHTHLIAFEEKDIDREEVKREFLTRPKNNLHAQLPFVFTRGIPIGGSSIIYALHTQGKMDKIFKHSIMDPDRYNTWLHNSMLKVAREPLILRVPVDSFPLVQDIMRGNYASTDESVMAPEVDDFLMRGASVVIKAQKIWNEKLLQNKYLEPSYLLYVQLSQTIWNVLYLMEKTLRRRSLSGSLKSFRRVKRTVCEHQ